MVPPFDFINQIFQDNAWLAEHVHVQQSIH
jgi:hypothetical protein